MKTIDLRAGRGLSAFLLQSMEWLEVSHNFLPSQYYLMSLVFGKSLNVYHKFPGPLIRI